MLERTTRSYFEDVISRDFNYFQSNIVKQQPTRTSRKRNSATTPASNDLQVEEHIMTRKTRTRRPRISALQSGYCAVCNVPYNSVEDHIQSKKHQKLIGEDANYIALNGSLNGFLQTNSIPFLNLNGIDAIGVHDASLDEFSSEYRKRAMRRTRAVSVICDRAMNPSPLSPTGSDITGHHLRSRRNINYMTPPLEDDSLQEKPDLTVAVEPEQENCRELRSTTRSLAKLVSPVLDTPHEEVWNSGRPKRACISKKRLSIDDRLPNCKTYYKVEVVTSKLRSSSSKNQETTKRQQSQSPKREEDKEKGLIVKFKKLRNSELIQLNNEATNFLFPKKEDSSEEDDDDGDGNTTVSSLDSSSNMEIEDYKSSTPKVKIEDEGSMDSMGKKKKRRTHAEAFIMDNQKYYKFETPGSRLRYQGSYLPMVLRSPDRPTKIEDEIFEEPLEKKVKKYDAKVKLDNYKFAFEKVPSKTGWYKAFQRLDNIQQSYAFHSNYLWECMTLPYQMRSIPPLDRKVCVTHYSELLKSLMEQYSERSSRASSAEPSGSASSVSLYEPDHDDDSKLSASTTSTVDSGEDKVQNGAASSAKHGRRTRQFHLVQYNANSSPSGSGGGKNPRKSPRQHASTLAILSDLIQQRKRRTRVKVPEESGHNLSTIEEEELPIPTPIKLSPPRPPTPPPPPLPPPEEVTLETNQSFSTPNVRAAAMAAGPSSAKDNTPNRKNKPKIDYVAIAKQIDEELDSALDDNLVHCELEIGDNVVDFSKSRTTISDILELYEENNSKETEKSCRRFFNGTPGRKPGFRRKKLNKTGWPNKSKRSTIKKEPNKEKNGDAESTVDSTSISNDTEDEEQEIEDTKPITHPPANTKKGKNKLVVRPKRKTSKQKQKKTNVNSACSRSNSENPKHRVNASDKEKILSKLSSGEFLQPYVCVQKLDSKKLAQKFVATPKRTNSKRQRRMPGSPKSPRMLRKPRGRWYRER